eukprot:scaffold164153_cov29-Tisochrysis_lutea.AAC.3
MPVPRVVHEQEAPPALRLGPPNATPAPLLTIAPPPHATHPSDPPLGRAMLGPAITHASGR